MPILGIKATIDAIKNTTILKILREGFRITDENNKIISNAYDNIVTDVGKAEEAIKIANNAMNSVQGAVDAASNAEHKAVEAEAKAVLAEEAAANASAKTDEVKVIAEDATKDTVIISDAVSVTVRATNVKGKVTDNPMPIASSTAAGAMNAQTFRGIESLKARVSDLENKGSIVYVTFDSDSPTDIEITGKFTSKSGQAPVASDTCIDIAKDLTFIYNGESWEKRPTAAIPLFKSNSAGLVVGADGSKAGTIVAEIDGTASVQGWDKVSTDSDKSINKLERVASSSLLSIMATKNDGTTQTINLDAVSSEKAGTLTPGMWAKVTKTSGDFEITGRYDFKLSPYVPEVKPNEFDSFRVAPVKQIHEAFVQADKKVDGITPVLSTVEGSTPDKKAIQIDINGKSSKTDLPGLTKTLVVDVSQKLTTNLFSIPTLREYIKLDYDSASLKITKNLDYIIILNQGDKNPANVYVIHGVIPKGDFDIQPRDSPQFESRLALSLGNVEQYGIYLEENNKKEMRIRNIPFSGKTKINVRFWAYD